MFAKADKPDDTSDQLSVVSLDVFGLPSHNFNCTSKNNKRTVTVSVMTYREGGKKEAGHNRQRKQIGRWKQGRRTIRRIREGRNPLTTNFCEMPRKSLSTRSLIFSQNLKENKLCISSK